jgi:hypothetical protein
VGEITGEACNMKAQFDFGRGVMGFANKATIRDLESNSPVGSLEAQDCRTLAL